jgi:hypothetical protein
MRTGPLRRRKSTITQRRSAKCEVSFSVTGLATRKAARRGVRYNDRVAKGHCTRRAEWKLPPGKSAEHLSPYYQLGCDYGTALMVIYKEGEASEPLYLCESHVAEVERSREDAAARSDVRAGAGSAEARSSESDGPSKSVGKSARKSAGKNGRSETLEETDAKQDVAAPTASAGRPVGAEQRGESATEGAHAADGQLDDVNRKIRECAAEIEAALSESTAKINVGDAIDKPLEQATLEIIGNGALGDAEKDAAIARLGALQEWIHRDIDQEITPLQANRIAHAIGDRVDAGKGADFSEELKPAYRAVHSSLKDAIRAAVPDTQNLKERLAKLYELKSDLENVSGAKALHPQTA